MENGTSVTRSSILKLIDDKEKIEAQLRELKGVLDRNNIGMSEPLVDREGYPREDIDVYAVRQARHKIICLQNDYKGLMNEIENGLHLLHSQLNSDVENTITSKETLNGKSESKPFAEIVHVDRDSPAYLAGLEVADLILSFGSVNSDNFKSMQDIASVVRHSVGHNVTVLVKRGTGTKKVTLIPKEWKGKGLLGCGIVELKNAK